MRPRNLLLLGALSLGVAAGAPAGALACGSSGYSYAGLSSRTAVSGIEATLSSLSAPTVENGHVAGWVGVGGPRLGPNGTSEWIQVGYAGFPGLALGSLYYEVTLPGGDPVFHDLSSTVQPGEQHRVAVLEVAGKRDWWRVWVDGAAVSDAYHLPASHGTWRGVVTAEDWGGGVAACNLYAYRFTHVSVATAPGGKWQPLKAAVTMREGDNQLVRASTSSFDAGTSTTPSP